MNHLPPGPMRRRGPRPLLLHLMLAGLRSAASLASLPTAWAPSRPGLPPWNGEAFTAIAAALAAPGGAVETDFAAAVLAELADADRTLIAGIAAYRRHPYSRELPDPPVAWAEGSARLLDYGGPGRPVLVVPSLVNRAHVLDLAEGSSFLRWLAANGARPLLLDHGWPDAAERRFTLTDHIAGRLLRAARAAAAIAGRPPVLAGYCMGGTMAVAAAAQAPKLFAALAVFAAPWDFHAADGGAQGASIAALLPVLEPLLAFDSTLPVDALQALFAALDPYSIAEKYRGFAALDPASARAEKFVALEDWLNDGVPLAAPVARECLADWYGRNTPARGAWRVAGLAVDPCAISMPGFVAIPARDRIVPPESAEPLAAVLPRATIHRPAAGHIGMVAGASAERALWQPFMRWLSTLP
jgi:poly(3-hydroxyalkanoate) synthetase